MNVAIDIPEDVFRRLTELWGSDLPRRSLEAIALEAYRAGVLTEFEVQRMLNLGSRWEVETFLKRENAYLDYSEAELEDDVAAIRAARAK